jgi:hypothetical protein
MSANVYRCGVGLDERLGEFSPSDSIIHDAMPALAEMQDALRAGPQPAKTARALTASLRPRGLVDR